jgi:hypothetical protein
MIKDSAQKQKAIRYCVAQGYVPYLEAVVRYSADTSETVSDITDVDVLGLRPAAECAARRLVFDCKTQAKISGVSRALWAAGLLKMIHADEAFVILSKAAPEGHRLAVDEIGIHLFSEKLFDDFGKSSSVDYVEGITYLDDLNTWEALHNLRNLSVKLTPLVDFLTCEAPFEDDPAAGFRSLIARLKQAEGEFDASKPTHLLLYGLVISQSLVFLSAMTRAFSSVFEPAMPQLRFENSLKNYVWGGKEGYALRQRLHIALQAGRTKEVTQFQFPGWERFIELQRSMLDAPFLVGSAALPVKDLAFRQLAIPREIADKRIHTELTRNARARQFALQTNRYIGGLSRLLQECSEHYASALSHTDISV